jgi:hypothetical protein
VTRAAGGPADAADPMVISGAPAPRQTPAAPSSQLAGLRERRAQARQRSKLDLVVPGYDPPVYVRFRALTPEELDRITTRHAKAKSSERALRMNSTVLATACIGIFEIDPDSGEEVSVDPENREGDWPRFDTRLAEILGVKAEKADDIVQALYVEKMHVLSMGDEVATWSSAADQELRRAEQGD